MVLPRLAVARHAFEPTVFAVHTVASGESLICEVNRWIEAKWFLRQQIRRVVIDREVLI